ncbi:trypsin-2-like isoform X2 [Cloeon dipterum]|uniref:trypsin-2-like isoform X2 n=1 Tax=Cloeon dipterum TaxID=197152 RepID=UPI0032200739
MLGNIVVLIMACCATLACGNPLELQQSLAKASNLQAFGGIPATRGEFPWHVSLQHFSTSGGWFHRCDGTIISESYVIASALLCSPGSKENMRAVAGTLEWKRPRSIHNVTAIIEDGDVRSGSGFLALFKVDPPFQFDCYTKAVQLPDHFIESLPGTVMTTTGWGHMMPDQYEPSDMLMKFELSVVSKAVCYKKNVIEMLHFMCANEARNETIGSGDCVRRGWGSPLIFNGELRGVLLLFLKCDVPDLYVEISLLRRWISLYTGV